MSKAINITKLMHIMTGVIFSTMILLSMSAGAMHHGDGEKKAKDIVDVAVDNGSFTTLATALKAAGLVDVLKGEGPYTVFAPTDEAFAKFPEGTVETLLKPENIDQLKAVLTYHVVSGQVLAADVVKLSSAKTVSGESVNIAVNDGKVAINESNVVMVDVMANNGVIHVIDTVLLPPNS